MKKYEKLVKAQ